MDNIIQLKLISLSEKINKELKIQWNISDENLI